MINVEKQEKIVGMYLSDFGAVYPSPINGTMNSFIKPEFNGYIPILNLFSFNNSNNIIFSNGINKDKEIVTFSKRNTSRNFNSTALKTKVEVTDNDLMLGPVRILLNLTDYNVTTVTKDNVKKIYKPVKNDNFEEFYGKIIVLTLRTFNTPRYVYDLTGDNNYLDTYLEIIRNKGQDVYSNIREFSQYLTDCWSNVKLEHFNCPSNSLKLVTMTEINESILVNDSSKTAYFKDLEIIFSIDDFISVPEHPHLTNNIINTADMQRHIKNNSFMCYIVDNIDNISDRYINIAGTVKKIGKVKNHNLIDGLYIMITDDEGKPSSELSCKLEDIDSNKYVFKNVEEANIGADIKNQYKDKVEYDRTELEALRIEKMSESLQLKNKYEAELKELNLEHERKLSDLKLTLDKKKGKKESKSFKLKNRSEKVKYDFDRSSYGNKLHYEETKYQRDSTVENLKMIGAVAGLVAGGVVLYSKMSGK